MFLIRQASKAIKRSRNIEHLTTARALQVWMNANRKDDTPPLDDIAIFLPHPAEFYTQNMQRRLSISRQTAIAVINSLSWLNSDVIAALDEWMDEIEMIAVGE